MINRWMTPKDIAALEGMPNSIQGVHKKAKRDGWPSRKKQGVQGPGIEYLLPDSDDNGKSSVDEGREAHIENAQDFMVLWGELVSRLSEDERNSILNHAIINGITSLLPNAYSQRSLTIAQLIETLSEEDQREILHLIEVKKLSALLNNTGERKKA